MLFYFQLFEFDIGGLGSFLVVRGGALVRITKKKNSALHGSHKTTAHDSMECRVRASNSSRGLRPFAQVLCTQLVTPVGHGALRHLCFRLRIMYFEVM